MAKQVNWECSEGKYKKTVTHDIKLRNSMDGIQKDATRTAGFGYPIMW